MKRPAHRVYFSLADRFRHNLVRLKRTGFFLCLCVIIIFGITCRQGISNSDRKKFITTYTELSLAYWKSETAPGRYSSLADVIFQKNGVDRKFLADIQGKMASNPQLQFQIYQEINERLKGYDNIPPDSLGKLFTKITDIP